MKIDKIRIEKTWNKHKQKKVKTQKLFLKKKQGKGNRVKSF
jgi:hypothetical protein